MDLTEENGVNRVSGVPWAVSAPPLDGLEPRSPCFADMVAVEVVVA
jgi:hypothetical protein